MTIKDQIVIRLISWEELIEFLEKFGGKHQKNGTTFPTSTSENFVTQTADEAKTGFRVVTSVLTPEEKQQ